MKIQVLMDNRIQDANLETEHGLSIYLEYQSQKWLLDTGASELFIKNAITLGVDIKDIDYVFISHGHSDHIGGLPAFLEMNTKAKVVISDLALNQKFFSTNDGLHDLGIDFNFSPYLNRFIFVYDFMDLGDGVYTFPTMNDKFPLPKGNLFLYKDSGYGFQCDDFDHELAICFGKEDLLVFTGCAHNGVLNILDLVKAYVPLPVTFLIGGFHLLDSTEVELFEKNEELDKISQTLYEENPQACLYTGHCTGVHTYRRLKMILGDHLNPFYTGFTLVL